MEEYVEIIELANCTETLKEDCLFDFKTQTYVKEELSGKIYCVRVF